MQSERQTYLTKEANSAVQKIFASLILKRKTQRRRQNFVLLLTSFNKNFKITNNSILCFAWQTQDS